MANKKTKRSLEFRLIPGQAKSKLASNPETPPVVLDKLSEHEQHDLVERVAENPNTPSETLDKLAKHESSDVRCAVGENTNASMDALQSLVDDDNPDVRYRMAENPNTPMVVLESLAEDENPFVCIKAQHTLESLKSVLQRADEMLVQERFSEAEQLYRLLVHGLEELLGAEHLELASALHKLAAALSGQSRLAEAMAVENRADMIKAVHAEASHDDD